MADAQKDDSSFTDEMFWGQGINPLKWFDSFDWGGMPEFAATVMSGTPVTSEQPTPDNKEKQLYQMAGGVALPDNPDAVVSPEDFTSLANQYGIDTEGDAFQAFLSAYGDGEDMQTAQDLVQLLANSPEYMKQPLATPYNQALVNSGFGLEYQYPVSQTSFKLAAQEGVKPQAVGPKTVTQPESGWIMYSNGVLVDPNAGNPATAVTFKPNSQAPGSYWWYRDVVSKWSPEKIKSEREHLADLGFLSRSDAKSGELDEVFHQALLQYHATRYFYGRESMNDATAAAAGTNPMMTAKDYQARIENNVRQQWLAVFGEEPTDAELSSWTRFTIREAVDLQREYMRRGVDEGTALSAGMTESTEATASRLWENPAFQHQRENVAENTKLRDAMERTISATRAVFS